MLKVPPTYKFRMSDNSIQWNALNFLILLLSLSVMIVFSVFFLN